MRYDDQAQVEAAGATGGSSDTAVMTVDGWLHVQLALRHVAHICCLRHRLTQAFAAKVCLSVPASKSTCHRAYSTLSFEPTRTNIRHYFAPKVCLLTSRVPYT